MFTTTNRVLNFQLLITKVGWTMNQGKWPNRSVGADQILVRSDCCETEIESVQRAKPPSGTNKQTNERTNEREN